ncbi:MAG: hypothetical protein SH817_13335 [Leptospira sp.]|nr:hypothetical protein [Leptospira sp.]
MANKQEIQEKVKVYLKSKERISLSISKIIDSIFNTPFSKFFVENFQLPPVALLDAFTKKSSRVSSALDLNIQNAYPFQTLSEGMQKETEIAIADFVSAIEVYPSKELLVDLLNQKAIQEIIANIIESGIIEFNKKTNPLFGMIQATGLDKQIKSFINLFLPNFLPKIADFLYKTSFGENSTLTRDIVVILLNAPMTELQMPNAEQVKIAEEKLEILSEKIKNDATLEKTLSTFISEISSRFQKAHGHENLIKFLELSTDDYQSLKKMFSDYLANEIVKVQNQNSIDELVAGIIDDILNQ